MNATERGAEVIERYGSRSWSKCCSRALDACRTHARITGQGQAAGGLSSGGAEPARREGTGGSEGIATAGGALSGEKWEGERGWNGEGFISSDVS